MASYLIDVVCKQMPVIVWNIASAVLVSDDHLGILQILDHHNAVVLVCTLVVNGVLDPRCDVLLTKG